MAEATRTEVFDIPRQDFYDVVADFESYPEFVEHMVEARVLERDGSRARVYFKAHMIRDIEYTLDIYHDEPRRVWWELVESPVFKVSNGSWTLGYKGKNRTEVVYAVEVAPRILVPSMIIKTLTQSTLPAMIRSFAERASNK